MENKTVEYAIEMRKITKVFNGTIIANENVDLKVKKGEVHALVGENGAGKSTLMSILFGLYQPTSGEIYVNGKPTIISSSIKANQLGIGMVHQHFKLVEVNKVWENIALGAEDAIAGIFLNKIKIKRQITEIMKKYNLFVDLDEKIENISVGMQQRVEIIKILYREAEILVFDEPTAVLTPNQIDSFLEIIKNLQAAGKTIIFITHKMDEIKKVANTATVIRLGKNIAQLDVAVTKENKIAEAMVGRKIVEAKNLYTPINDDKVILNIANLTVKKETNHRINALESFNIKVHAGEILAIAGVEGNGQKELAEAIVGLKKPSSGGIIYKDVFINNLSIKKRYKMGMSHIPEDRHKHGIVLDFSVEDNIVLSQLDEKEFSTFGFLNKAKIKIYAKSIIQKFDVRGSRGGAAISRQLSGGNQQKLIIGREMTKDHDLIIVIQPTRGLDVGAIETIHAEILKEKEAGKAVLLISYELNEILALADNIAVINDGKLIGTLPGKGAKKETIGLLMTGEQGGINA